MRFQNYEISKQRSDKRTYVIPTPEGRTDDTVECNNKRNNNEWSK